MNQQKIHQWLKENEKSKKSPEECLKALAEILGDDD